jgi:hypothetical protein
MIKVDGQTHARLAKLAEEQGVTIGGLVGELATARPTRADSDAFLATIEARFGRPDADALDRMHALLDQYETGSGKKNPAA